MTRKDWFGVLYVSIWVMIWGTLGSLIDYPLLQSQLYEAGSLGQISTFAGTAILSIFLGVLFFKPLSNKFSS